MSHEPSFFFQLKSMDEASNAVKQLRFRNEELQALVQRKTEHERLVLSFEFECFICFFAEKESNLTKLEGFLAPSLRQNIYL